MFLKPDSISYNAAISACEKRQQWRTAVGLLREMPGAQLEPEAISYGAVISACEKAGQWPLALSLLREMPDVDLRPDVVNYAAAISACQRQGLWPDALALLHEIPGYERTTIAYNAVIAAIAQSEETAQWPLALHLVQEMAEVGLDPSSITYASLIQAAGDDPVGQKLFQYALDAGAFPDLFTKGPNVLETHGLSAWAATQATRWWLMGPAAALIEDDPTITDLKIIVGQGFGRKEWQTEDVRASVSTLLSTVGLAHEHDGDNEGRWVVSADDVRKLAQAQAEA